MGSGEEFEKDGRVDGQIPTHAKGPQGVEAPYGRKVGRAGRDEAKHARDAEGEVEPPATAEDVASKPPEHGAGQETNVLRQGQQRRSTWTKLVRDRGEDERRDDGP